MYGLLSKLGGGGEWFGYEHKTESKSLQNPAVFVK